MIREKSYIATFISAGSNEIPPKKQVRTLQRVVLVKNSCVTEDYMLY